MTVKRPKIHWKKYLTRKMFILAVFAVAGYTIEHVFHIWFLGKGAEFAVATIVEHTIFDIPMEGVS